MFVNIDLLTFFAVRKQRQKILKFYFKKQSNIRTTKKGRIVNYFVMSHVLSNYLIDLNLKHLISQRFWNHKGQKINGVLEFKKKQF